MKIDRHDGISYDRLRANYLQVPHECTIPSCPGNINRLKLEMWDEMLAALIAVDGLCVPFNTLTKLSVGALITKAKKLEGK